MRYIVVEHNSKDPSSPIIRVYGFKAFAMAYYNDCPNQCRLYAFGEDMKPIELEPDLLVKPEEE